MIKFGTAAYNVAVTVWPILVAAFQIGKAYLDNLYQSWMAIGSYLANRIWPHPTGCWAVLRGVDITSPADYLAGDTNSVDASPA